jgi:NAD(P)-dependent dehydrogenase (short-subunit alcohol dehydrogenase family)
MDRLSGKVALVTGAASEESIGWAIATELASEGADIAINDLGRDEQAEALAAELRRTGRRAIIVLGDVSLVAECRRIVAETVAALGRLDILVNNAGGGRRTPFEDVTEAEYDQQLAVHLKGPFFLSQAAAPHLRVHPGSRIINISSEMAYLGAPDLAHYTAAKAGLCTLTKSIALALAPDVTVNTICPGPTATRRFRTTIEFTPATLKKIPLKRWGAPHDVARTAVFLATSDGDAFTGQTLDPNNGVVMR